MSKNGRREASKYFSPVNARDRSYPQSEAVSISELLGTAATLPGEDAQAHQISLQSLIEELEARTTLQVYIAEKIHECLWWIHRYEQQKRASVISTMSIMTMGASPDEDVQTQAYVRDSLMQGKVDDVVLAAVRRAGHTLESLRHKAFGRRAETLRYLDDQIALRAKVLAGLQASYEIALNRKSNAERLKLQNELMRKNLEAIDIPVQEVSPNEQRKARRRKSS